MCHSKREYLGRKGRYEKISGGLFSLFGCVLSNTYTLRGLRGGGSELWDRSWFAFNISEIYDICMYWWFWYLRKGQSWQHYGENHEKSVFFCCIPSRIDRGGLGTGGVIIYNRGVKEFFQDDPNVTFWDPECVCDHKKWCSGPIGTWLRHLQHHSVAKIDFSIPNLNRFMSKSGGFWPF